MSREVCVLDRVRAELYEHKGIIPDCLFHRHEKAAVADTLVGANDGMASARRLTPQRDPVTGYFDRKERIVMLPLMILRPREGVVCLVRGVVSGHNTGVRKRFSPVRGKGMKYAVGMVGVHSRQTSARTINYIPPKLTNEALSAQ